MRKKMIRMVLVASGSSLVAGTMPAGASAAVISDTFTNNTTNRAADSTLNGIATEVGGATWGASKFKFTNDNTVQNTGSGGSAWVDAPTIVGVVTVEVDLELSSDSANWGAVYLSNSVTNVPDFWNNVQLLLNYSDSGSGTYNVYANGTGKDQKIAEGTVAPGAGPAHLMLTYDPAANQVSAKIDDTVVLSDYSLGMFTPDIKTAGMFVTGNVTYQFDNFKLTIVPEPAGASLLLLGGLGAMSVRRRRR